MKGELQSLKNCVFQTTLVTEYLTVSTNLLALFTNYLMVSTHRSVSRRKCLTVNIHIYMYTYFIHQILTGKKKYLLAAFAECLTGNTSKHISPYLIQKMSNRKTYLFATFRTCPTVKHIYLLHSENV